MLWGATYAHPARPRSAAESARRAMNTDRSLLTHIVSIKREIGHLCHDENKQNKQGVSQPQTTTAAPPAAQVSIACTSNFCLISYCARHTSPSLSVGSYSVSVHAAGAVTRELDADYFHRARSAHDTLH
jgi:hypothetical protein